MKNKKGFTLVELLAVIVVLAIIMIIAVPSVLNSMTDARRNSFAVYGEKLINSAQAQAQSTAMVNGTIKKCYTIDDLVDGAHGSYEGYVQRLVHGEKEYYFLTLRDSNYAAVNILAQELEAVKSGVQTTYKTHVIVGRDTIDADTKGKEVTFTECPATPTVSEADIPNSTISS